MSHTEKCGRHQTTQNISTQNSPHCWGDRITYDGNVSTPTADISTTKVLLISTISTDNALFITYDISNFYLGTPIQSKEYMVLPFSFLPSDIIQQYKLSNIIHNNKVYIEISKGIYGLPQAGILDQQQLIKVLKPHVYAPCWYTPGLWTHCK